MRFVGLILLYSLLISTSGCAYLYAQRDDIDDIIEKWVIEKEYGQALDALSEIKTTHPKYLQLMLRKKEIIAEASKFENRSINQASFYISANKWEDAYAIYQFSLNKLPTNKKLDDSYIKFLQKRAIYIHDLEYKLLVTKAQQMVNDLPVQKKIAIAMVEDKSERNKYEDLKHQAQEISNNLSKCAKFALEQRKLAQATRCIDLAKKLQPTKDINTLLEIVANDIADIKEKAQKVKQKEKEKRQLANKVILKEYKAAYQKDDLLTAKKKMTRLLALNKDDYEINKLKDELQETINKKVQSGIEAGRLLYVQGDIKLALDKWTVLQKLVPSNKDLLGHIDRAETVLRNLKNLQKGNRSNIQPPSPKNGNES